jgi:hypothetical protein
MKNTKKSYTTTIRGNEYTFTAHSTKAGARGSVNERLNPCLVEVEVDGILMYDAFPGGHPLPSDAEVIERCCLSVSGMRWRKVETPEYDAILAVDARTGRGY